MCERERKREREREREKELCVLCHPSFVVYISQVQCESPRDVGKSLPIFLLLLVRLKATSQNIEKIRFYRFELEPKKINCLRLFEVSSSVREFPKSVFLQHVLITFEILFRCNCIHYKRYRIIHYSK